MKTIFKLIVISLLIIIGSAFIFSSCNKDKKCTAVVIVRRLTDTSVVPNATVKLYSKIGNLQQAEGLTDASGQFSHTFNLEAILNISAIKKDSLDSLYGNSLIQLVAGGTASKTVYVNP